MLGMKGGGSLRDLSSACAGFKMSSFGVSGLWVSQCPGLKTEIGADPSACFTHVRDGL